MSEIVKTIWSTIRVVVITFGLLVFVVMLAFWLWKAGALNAGRPQAVDLLNLYEQEYARCIARETIGHDECHDIAIHVAYPDKADSNFNGYINDWED